MVWWYTTARLLLGFSEREAQRATIRRIEAVFRAYNHLHGKKMEDEITIDDIIPV